ncbi:MAG: hypothetical protein QM772_02030 [Ottowia sp.]|uniref:hypothetical protein n=1 Tax=Ottowia sp. TaxID=1898956 RepID=UPI0039E5F592
MKSKFYYDDIVRVSKSAPLELRPGAIAWVVGIFFDRIGDYIKKFPEGIVYTIEYDDGNSNEIHEDYLDAYDKCGGPGEGSGSATP